MFASTYGNISRMSNANMSYGPAMMRYVDGVLNARGVSRPWLTKRVQFSESLFSRWAKGGTEKIDLDKVRQIADGLGVSAVELLTRAGFLTEDEAAGRIASHSLFAALDPETGDPAIPLHIRAGLRSTALLLLADKDGTVKVN
jgi:transcriptional regulator with XRE-family HTH domain